jgi:hypothetical protein
MKRNPHGRIVSNSDEWPSVAQTTDEAYDNEHDAHFYARSCVRNILGFPNTADAARKLLTRG